MQKMSVIRFKPKSEFYDEFLDELMNLVDEGRRATPQTRWVLKKDDEIISIAIRDEIGFADNVKGGVNWLDTVRHMLHEWNPRDRHTLPLTGEII